MALYHKFRARPVVIDDIWFGSTKEGKRYTELNLLRASGEVLFFLRQVPFDLPAKPDAKEKEIPKYRCDFMVFWKDGTVTIEEVKGYRTKDYILKKKLVEALYPIEITEI